MKSSVLAEKFVRAMERACNNDANLEKACRKIESIFKGYAREKEIKYAELRVSDISDAHGEVQPRLLRFIASRPRLPEQSERRRERYIAERTSGVRRLIRAIAGLRSNSGRRVLGQPELALIRQMPDYLRPVLEKLPKAKIASTEPARQPGPADNLTERGQLLLLTLCQVDQDFNISQEPSPLKTLLCDHLSDVRDKLRSLTLSALEHESVRRILYKLLSKLNMKAGRRTTDAVKVENWPQPLRGQYHRFLKLVTSEMPPESSLPERAAKHKFPLEEFSPESITNITLAISRALSLFRNVETLGIEDLIRLQSTNVTTEEGEKVQDRNCYAEQVRELERAKSTGCKRLNFDSAVFKSYIFAVKAVAARTGYGHLIEPFNQAYRLHLDQKSKQARKDEKKQGITLQWMDEELERLGTEFDRIVNKRLFVRRPGRGKRQADHAMRLCLFYPQILTKRLVGYRQQAIRKAIDGKNIVFLQDGTVSLYFAKKEVKNKRAIKFEIKPMKEGTHERLRDVLITYKTKVLPYIRRHGKDKVGQHFFAQFDGLSGGFRAFGDNRDYACFFKRRVREFLNVNDLEPHLRDALHAHFLRGMCADWMYTVLHLSREEIAEVLGDTVKVTDRDYLDRNRVRDATPIFDKINATCSTKDDTNSKSNGGRLPKEFTKLLERKEREIDMITDSFHLMKQQLTEKISELEARLAQSPTPRDVVTGTR